MTRRLLLILLIASAACARARPITELSPRQDPPRAVPDPVSATTVATGDALLDYLRTRALMVPVDGVRVAQVPDNFSAGRAGRSHNAHDLMARRGTPVLSADDGRIIRLSSNSLGGITIYATDTGEKLVYYYAHLDRYAAGLRAGAAVKKGEVLGYVGSTGNASATAPHLHFQVGRMTDIAHHWDAEPVDARAYFTLDGKRR